jgi:hypothetical protein
MLIYRIPRRDFLLVCGQYLATFSAIHRTIENPGISIASDILVNFQWHSTLRQKEHEDVVLMKISLLGGLTVYDAI